MSRVSAKPYFVYVLWSESGQRFYIGVTEDPQHRLRQHNEIPRGWAARHRPWVIVHTERFQSYREARRRELLLKRQKSGQGFFQMTGLDIARFREQKRSLGS